MASPQPHVPSWIAILVSVLVVGWAGAKVNQEPLSLAQPGAGAVAGATVGFLIGVAIFLDDQAVRRRAGQPVPEETPERGTTRSPELPAGPPSEWLAAAMLVIPVVATVLTWPWQIFHLPPRFSTAVGYSAVVVTSILGYIDARRLSAHAPRTDGSNTGQFNPVLLFVGMLGLWLLCFPIYFFARRRMGARNFGVPAVVVALVFIAPAVAGYFVPPELPPVDDREVLSLVTGAYEGSPEVQARRQELGKITVSDPVEVSFDPDAGRRVARAELNSNAGSQVIFYSVEWQDRKQGVFQVRVIEKP